MHEQRATNASNTQFLILKAHQTNFFWILEIRSFNKSIFKATKQGPILLKTLDMLVICKCLANLVNVKTLGFKVTYASATWDCDFNLRNSDETAQSSFSNNMKCHTTISCQLHCESVVPHFGRVTKPHRSHVRRTGFFWTLIRPDHYTEYGTP